MNNVEILKRLAMWMTVAALAGWQVSVLAQEGTVDVPAPTMGEPDGTEAIEEVVVLGRFISASQQVMNERINDSAVSDLLDADTISRLGDSTVSAALRRVPGLSLVQDKFVYIRGLGERYSTTYLNGAQIPSPDLTRNVIPLDVFPTAIVQSLKVQKAWSPDLPASFGGGAVDIRTKGVPDSFTWNLEVGAAYNTLTDGDGLTYPGGGDDWLGTDDGTRSLSPAISDALNAFQGNIGVQNIFNTLQRQDPGATVADAQLINRNLGLELNRDIGLESRSLPLDARVRAAIGNTWDLSDDWQFGASVGGTYQTFWRQTTARSRNFNFPETRTDTEEETRRSVNLSGTLNLGFNYLDDHSISTTSLYLRTTDDEVAVTDFFNENREIPDGLGFRGYRLQFEERNMITHQVRGEHYLGEETRGTFAWLGKLLGPLPTRTRIDWFYSDSNARTDIPNQVSIASQTVTDPVSATVMREQVALSNTAGDWRFTDLDDDVENYGWSFALPIQTDRSYIEFSGGANHASKVRTYQQTQFSLGVFSVADNTLLQGPLDSVFADSNIADTGNDWVFDRQGTNRESYIAATITDAVFGAVDWTYDDTWRVAVGARWEDYRQAAVDWNPYGFSLENPQVTTDPAVLEQGTFANDDIYPSVALTYIGDLWADTFQVRLGYSETAVRPDLREITAASYIDPVTDDLTRGNPGVEPSDVRNFDLRGEWFFGNGDNFTITFYRKELDKPIEFFESAASDTTVAREILNATSATINGIELEGLKELGFMGDFMSMFFVQGNLTIQDSELVCDINDANSSCFADAPTTPNRPLTGASDYVGNFMFGWDSPEAKHTASLMYNVFSERLYVAGRNGIPNGYEQPFQSLDLTYFWYPTDSLTLKFKAQNLLDESIRIERGGVQVFEEKPGQSFVLTLQWSPL